MAPFAPAILSTAFDIVERERVVLRLRYGVRTLVLHKNRFFPKLGDDSKTRREVSGGRWLRTMGRVKLE